MHFTYQQKIKKKAEGSILVLVLVVIGLLSFLTIKFIDDSVDDLEYQYLFNHPNELRSQAYNALEISLAVLHEIAKIDDKKIYHPLQGWGDPLAYYEFYKVQPYDITIDIIDPTGKLPLNSLDEKELLNLLEEGLDIDFSIATELSDAWFDWIDSNDSVSLNGFESEYYENKDPPYRAPNRPILSFEELKLIEVWNETFFDDKKNPNILFYQLLDLTTIINAEKINVNAAKKPVLDYLLADTGWDAESLFAIEDKPYITKLPESLNNKMLTTDTDILTIKVTINRGNIPYTINALVKKKLNDSVVNPNLPGKQIREKNKILKLGTPEEQLLLQFPFEILEISEHNRIEEKYNLNNLN